MSKSHSDYQRPRLFELGIRTLQLRREQAIIAFIEGIAMKAICMAQLTVRNVAEQVVRALKKRAAEHGRSAEAEHRDILRESLLAGERHRSSFACRAEELRRRLRSSVESTELIRADRDRDHTA